MLSKKKEILYDVRLVKRHVGKKLISEKDYDAQLKSLPDQTDNAIYVDYEQLNDLGQLIQQ